MASIIIPASNSLTVTNKIPDGNINEDVIIVGRDGDYNYFSYLFFDISLIPGNASITYAELVLFKTDNFYNDKYKAFGIYPLNDYFSIYTTFNNHPRIDNFINQDFNPITSKVAVTAVLTSFISLWNSNSFMNTGIMLYGKDKDTLARFGSSINKDKTLIPFLRVCYNSTITQNIYNYTQNNYYNNDPPIRQVQVTGTVAAFGKYDTVVNVGVLRKDSGHVDNYYVTDEHDNTKSNFPYHVNKIYNIPVFPKPAPGDSEDIKVYGAYKD